MRFVIGMPAWSRRTPREGGEMARRDVSVTFPARPLHMVITASPRQAMAQKAPQLEVSQAAVGYRVHWAQHEPCT
jgi:hypothetical protein